MSKFVHCPGSCPAYSIVTGPGKQSCSLHLKHLKIDAIKMHPLGLCNNNDEEDLYEYGWVGVVKLEQPELDPKPCLTVLGKGYEVLPEHLAYYSTGFYKTELCKYSFAVRLFAVVRMEPRAFHIRVSPAVKRHHDDHSNSYKGKCLIEVHKPLRVTWKTEAEVQCLLLLLSILFIITGGGAWALQRERFTKTDTLEQSLVSIVEITLQNNYRLFISHSGQR
ncbi:hypothetical protein STEG23_015673 [Scotinomys teguina]